MLKKISTILLILTGVDVLILSAFGLLSPLFAIFVTKQIVGGTATVVGFATAVYFIAKSLVQIPIGRFIDKHSGEKDDFLVLIIGHLSLAVVPFLYLLADTFSYLRAPSRFGGSRRSGGSGLSRNFLAPFGQRS